MVLEGTVPAGRGYLFLTIDGDLTGGVRSVGREEMERDPAMPWLCFRYKER